MFQVSDDSSDKVVHLANYKTDLAQKAEQKEEQNTANKPKAVCEGGVCRLEWKPTRPSSGANAA